MRHRKGFTLIELLVVIAIISLLVSILLPSLKKAKDMALSVVCMSNLRGVGMANVMFAEEADGFTPYIATFWFSDSRRFPGRAWHQTLVHDGFTEDSNVFLCPSSNYPEYLGGYNDTYEDENGVPLPNNGGVSKTYGMRSHVQMAGAEDPRYNISGAGMVTGTDTTGNTITFGSASEFLYIADSIYFAPFMGGHLEPFYYFYTNIVTDRPAHLRHNGSANFAFADAHVESLDSDDLLGNYGGEMSDGTEFDEFTDDGIYEN